MNTNHEKAGFEDLFKFDGQEQEYSHDSYMLMSGFLSEIELIQKQQNVSRKELAKKISISPSYLTQVFRNNKPLNFYTLAKIKKALNIRFSIKAIPLNEVFANSTNVYFPVSNSELQGSISSITNVWIKDTSNSIASSQTLTLEKS